MLPRVRALLSWFAGKLKQLWKLTPKRGQQAILLLAGFAMAAFVLGSAAHTPGGGIHVEDRYCEQSFGDGWEYSGYMIANPPVVYCRGPDGQTGLMDMPQEVANKHGVTATAYNRTGGV